MNHRFKCFELAIARSFSISLCIHSPRLNGLSIEIGFACLLFRIRSSYPFGIYFNNYWANQSR